MAGHGGAGTREGRGEVHVGPDVARADPVLAARLVRASYETDLGEVRAFLPGRVPLDGVPAPFARHLSACAELPSRYAAERGGPVPQRPVIVGPSPPSRDRWSDPGPLV